MDNSPSAVIGSNVRAEMARRGITQTALAEQLGFTQSALSKRLRGVTPFDVNELARCANALGVTSEALMHGVAEPVESAS